MWLNALTHGIFHASNGNTGVNNGNNGSAFASRNFFLSGSDQSTSNYGADQSANRFWGTTFAGGSFYDGSGTTGDVRGKYAGFMVGAHAAMSENARLGVFGGVAKGKFEGQTNSHDIVSEASYLGAYAHLDQSDYWTKLVLVAGWSDQDSERNVANNLVVGGIETASADYSAFFVSPALTVGAHVADTPSGLPVIGSFTAHYAGMFIDGYTETGVTNPVTVGDRDIHTLGTRFELSLPQEKASRSGGTIRTVHRIGVDYQYSPDAQTVDATVAGLPLNFEAQIENQRPGGFVGMSFGHVSADGMQVLEADVQARVDTGGSAELGGKVSLKLAF